MKVLEYKFNKTLIDAEIQFKRKREQEDKKLTSSETYNSLNHVVISLEKVLENLSEEFVLEHKNHIDNIYYHLGAIKGCL